MSTFEKKLARFREEQERKTERNIKERYGMSKRHKENLIKSLEKQIKEATDPELKAKLSATLGRVLTTKPEARAKRSKDFPIKAQKGTSPIVAKWADRLSHVEPEGKRIETSVICEVHERDREHRKSIGQPMSKDEIRALIEELFNSLSA